MIEMLGVLAVVGLLSIGGLVAYRRAMIRHLANSVIEDINLAGFVLLDGLYKELPDNDEGLDLTGRFEQTSPYTYKGFAETKETFEILVQGVPYPVCQDIVERKIEDMAGIEEIRANGLAEECFSDSGENEMSFFFGEDENATPCNDDTDCGTCGICGPKHTCRGECEVEPVECTTNADCTDFCSGCIIEEGAESGTCQYACEPVAYLESSALGNDYIETNWHVNWDRNVKVSGTFSVPDITIRRIIMGAYPHGKELNIEQHYLEEYIGTSEKFRIWTGAEPSHCTYDKKLPSLLPTNTPVHFTYEYNAGTGKHTFSANGETTSISHRISGKSGGTEKLFSDYRHNCWGALKIYNITIKNDSTQMRLTPVLDPDGVPAMLDKVNKQLYYNAGSGTFKTDKD